MTNDRIVRVISYFSCRCIIISKELNLSNKYLIFVCRRSHTNEENTLQDTSCDIDCVNDIAI